jgi:hypothetical protein
MRTSFLGIVSDEGLESLVPECEATRGWLHQMAKRRRVACVWAVMELSVASEIADLLADGESQAAFRHMEIAAESVGRML